MNSKKRDEKKIPDENDLKQLQYAQWQKKSK